MLAVKIGEAVTVTEVSDEEELGAAPDVVDEDIEPVLWVQ